MRYSLLDLSPVPEGREAADAIANSVDLARHAEALGFSRYWLAEHHNMPGIASAATSVLIGHIAGATKTMRVGAGGVMLPNHSPLAIAEQFGTLATIYPGRIDLGLGRAPGGDMAVARALRRGKDHSDRFPDDVAELISYLAPRRQNAPVRAIWGKARRFRSGFSALHSMARNWRPFLACLMLSLPISRPMPWMTRWRSIGGISNPPPLLRNRISCWRPMSSRRKRMQKGRGFAPPCSRLSLGSEAASPESCRARWPILMPKSARR